MDIKPKKKVRESPAGFHFYHHYLNCPWKWYLHYILGIAPRYRSRHLIFGGLIHEAFDHYYKNGLSADDTIAFFSSRIEEEKNSYEKFTDFQEDAARGPHLLSEWESTIGVLDRERYEYVESEVEYVLELGPPEATFLFTIRPDLVKRHRETGEYHLFDYKTTGYSISKTIFNAQMDDQVTAYILALQEHHPEWEIEHAFIDVLYNRKSRYEAVRSEPIYRDATALNQFRLNIVGIIHEITSKVKALEDGYPRHLLFPRNGRICGLFGCEYEAICRTDPEEGVVPPGFIADTWTEKKE